MQLIKLEELIKTHLVMTSREIADLTGKTIGHINRDIKSMLKELKPHCPDLDSNYRTVSYSQKTGVGIKSNIMYELDKKLTLCLTSGYSAVLRLKIIDRVSELEAENNSLKSRIKSAYDDMELIKVNGSLWGKAGVIQRKQKHEAKDILTNLISQAQMKLF